tara:strand:+ start:11970 stop:12707 length:738 start_codon:yes stop_codon:yes gene_type:complete
MVTKSQIKQIKQLKYKKYREKTGLFVAEGKKIILDLLEADFDSLYIFSTSKNNRINSLLISKNEMSRLTHFKSGSEYLGVFIKPSLNNDSLDRINVIIALDEISDPGNLGTIIRTCDWFGINHIICSTNTVDCFNPKVIQATMGSISRVFCYYKDLPGFLKNYDGKIYCTDLYSKSIYQTSFAEKSVFVFGNESKGISNKVLRNADEKISIPKENTIESINSLNVASSVSVVLAENFRQKLTIQK